LATLGLHWWAELNEVNNEPLLFWSLIIFCWKAAICV